MKKFKLTQSQLSIWIGQKLNPHSPLYNMAHAFHLYGAINVENFKKAFSALLQHSDALRCVFIEEQDHPYQHIKPSVSYDMEFFDFSSLNETEIQNKLKARTKVLFNLEDRVFDSILIKAKEDHYLWFLNIHHLVTDATSSTLLFSLMGDLYESFNASNPIEIKPVPQFESYLEFEANQHSNKKNSAIVKYWEDKISTIKNLPELYGRKNNNATTKAKRVVLSLGKARSEKLALIAQQPEIRAWTKDLTLFNIFTSILFVYLNRISGASILSIGAPSHNRPSKTFKETPGIFIEFFPLVTELDVNDTYFDVLQRIKLETNNYLRHTQSGISNADLNKSYNVTLNFINTSFSDFNGIPMASQWIHPDHIDANHALRLNVYDMDNSGDISLLFDLNSDVFDDSLEERMPKHFLSVFDDFIANIEKPILNQSIATPSEKKLFLASDIEIDAPFTSVIEHFENIAKNYLNAQAIQFKDETLTYKDLNAKANQLARYLVKQGITPNSKIVLYNYRNLNFMVSLLATMKLGGVFIPVASNQPIERLKNTLSTSKAAMVLTDESLINNIEGVAISTLALNSVDAIIENELEDNLNIKPHQDHLAYVLFTSGSTGNPKGVQISQSAFSNYLFWAKDYYGVTNSSIFPLFTSIGFDLTITSLFLPLLSGGKMVIYEEDKTGSDMSLIHVINENLVNTIKLTPSHLALFSDLNIHQSKLELMIVGGEDFKVNLAKTVTDLIGNQLKIYNEYGPTEATVGCIVSQFDDSKHSGASVPIGKPTSNMHGYILDENKNLVVHGVPGELFLAGKSLANGYLQSKDLTDEKFIDNPFVQDSKMYKTGDFARINSDGDYEYLGRVDEQVKLRGYRIELADIESNLIGFEDIENCSVLLLGSNASDTSNEKLVGFYSSVAPISSDTLSNYLSRRLPEYMIPSAFKHLDEMPLTKNGKIDKKKLSKINVDDSSNIDAFVPPQSEIEEIVHEVWLEVLRVDQIGIHENFIRIGGNSLSAISITSRLKSILELDISITDVFNYPTIAAYAANVEKTITELLND